MTDRNDVNTDQGKAVLDQIDACIERATSLAEAENEEALKELSEEAETLISSLSGKGSIAVKKEKRAAFEAASKGQPKSAPKPETSTEVVAAKDWTAYPDVVELVSMGAERTAEGVRLHLKTSTTAKEIANIILDMWRRLPNKDGLPDIMGNSDPAKKASGALLRKAGEGFEHTYDNEQALKKLQRSIQDQRSDVRAQYLRSLDDETPEAEEERQRYASVLANKPADVPVSKFIADLYGTSLKGQGEIKRERYQQQKELEGAGKSQEEETETPDERVAAVVKKLAADIKKAKPEDFEAASAETKETVRAELETLYNAVKAMITATL